MMDTREMGVHCEGVVPTGEIRKTLCGTVASSGEGWPNKALSPVSGASPTPLQDRPIRQEPIGEPSLTPFPVDFPEVSGIPSEIHSSPKSRQSGRGQSRHTMLRSIDAINQAI